jgi:transcriptional regulator with XRE-family HTH domain
MPISLRADDPIAIANLIRSARERADLTQKALAARLGTTQSVVSRWESGRDEPRLSTVARIMRACGFRLTMSAEPDDVDRTQIQHHLAMTPAQRIATVKNVSRFVNAARRAR